MCRLREQIRHAVVMAQPRTELARVLGRAGVPNANSEADHLYWYMRRPGRAGVRAVVNTYRLVFNAGPPESHALVVVEMFERKVNRHGFAAVLPVAWRYSGGTMHRIAGSETRMAEMFSYAQMDDAGLPFLEGLCGLGGLPDTFTAYRGGRGTPEEVATRGLSWSKRPWPASRYALRTEDWWAKPYGPPVILRREVRREEVLCWIKANDELILSGFGPYEIDTADEAEIQTVYDAGKGELESAAADAEAYRAATLAASEDELFAGWEG